MNVLAVTPETIKAYEDERSMGARTIVTKQAKLAEFFRFTLFKGWRRDNPVERLHVLFRIEMKRAVVSILSVEDVRSLLEAASQAANAAEVAPYLAVRLFAGFRPSEVERLDWRQVHLSTRQIEVLAEISKNSENRFVTIEGNILAWLDKFKKLKGRIVPELNWRRKWDDLRIAAGYALLGRKGRVWPDDVLRHSYTSYWLVTHHDRARLAEQLGNSVEVIRSHYRRAISPEVAKTYWEIMP